MEFLTNFGRETICVAMSSPSLVFVKKLNGNWGEAEHCRGGGLELHTNHIHKTSITLVSCLVSQFVVCADLFTVYRQLFD